MKSILRIGVLLCCLCFFKLSFAQTPQFIVQDNIGANIFPLSTSLNNKCQFLFTAGEFTVGPLIAGNITKIYILPTSTITSTTFTNFSVSMGMTTATNTPGVGSTPNTPWLTGLTTVIAPTTKTFTGITNGGWIPILLDSPFPYDGTSNLIVEISQTSYTSGITLYVNTATTYGNRRIYGPVAGIIGTSNTGRLNFGMDITPVITGSNNAGMEEFVSPVGSYCSGTQPVKVVIKNAGTNTIDSVQLKWQVDGVAQPMVNYTNSLASLATDTVLLGNVTMPAAGTPAVIKAWTTMPNGVADVQNGNDTIMQSFQASQFVIASNTDTTCSGSSVSFTLNPSSGYAANSIQWQSSVDGGTTWTDIVGATGVTYSATNLTANKSFRVKIGTGTNTCTSNTKDIVILAMPTITATGGERCGTGTVVLIATGSAGSSPTWYGQATGGSVIANGSSYTTPVISTTTTFYVSSKLNYAGCESSRIPVVATIKPLPVVDLGNDTTICGGATIILDAGNIDSTYLWSTLATTSTIAINNSGTYFVEVRGKNNCTSSDTIVVTPGIAPVNNLLPNYNLCQGSTLTLDAGNPGSTFLWNNATANQTRTVNSGGNYSVTITSPDECTLVSNTTVSMHPLPIVQLGNDTAICSSDSITLNAGNVGSTYIWSTGATTQTIQVAIANTYSVFVTTAFGCIASDEIKITNLPEPTIEGFDFIDLYNEQYGKVKFKGINPINVTGYEWDFGDGSPLSTAVSPTHVYTTRGVFTVTLKVINQCGEYSISLTIYAGPVGISKIDPSSTNLALYPNPSRNEIIIETNDQNMLINEISITNVLGVEMQHTSGLKASKQVINVSQLASGIYQARVNTNKGWMVKKFEIIR